MKILIADDEPAALHTLQTLLTRHGYEVVCARDGNAAWAALQAEEPPDLAIIDWMMPGIDGAEICRRLREIPDARYVYVVMLTAKESKADLVQALDAGADDYLIKPFHVEELQARVRAGARILKLQEALRIQATHDHLTGVLNRGAVLDFAQRELAQAARRGETASIMLVDLDNFKQVNDRYGHPVGDCVLRETAQRLASTLRKYDALGRFGGEEFLAVLPGCTHDDVRDVAARMRASVAAPRITTSAGPLGITVSLGFSVSSAGCWKPLEALIADADEALYRAKRSGRDRAMGPLAFPRPRAGAASARASV